MILPKDIKSRNKIRDAKIINDWLNGKTQEQLAKELGITRQAIYCIIRKNKEVINLDEKTSKLVRVHYLNNALVNSKPSEKDRLEIIESLRKEYEGDSKISVQSSFLIVDKTSEVKNRLDTIENQSQ